MVAVPTLRPFRADADDIGSIVWLRLVTQLAAAEAEPRVRAVVAHAPGGSGDPRPSGPTLAHLDATLLARPVAGSGR